jgi:hypothetical protein
MAASRYRRWLLLGSALVALLAVVAGTAVWWLARTYGPSITRDRIEEALAAAVQRPVRIERVVLRPWLGRLALEGVAVGAGATWEAGTLVEARQIAVHAGISSLWRRELVLSRIQLHDVNVHYVATAAGGGFSAVPLAPERIVLGPVTVTVRAIGVDRLGLDYHEPAAGRRVAVEGGTVTLRPTEGALDVVAGATRLTVAAPGLDETLEAIEASGRLTPDRLLVRSLRARWLGANARLEGEVAAPFAAPELMMRLDADLPLARLAPRLGASLPVGGTVRVRATVQGAWPGPTVTATATAPEVTVGDVRARRVTAEGRWSDGELAIRELSAQAFGGTVRASLALRPDRLSEGRVQARLAQVAVPELEKLAGHAVGIDGRATLEAELVGDLRQPTAGRGWLRLEPSSLSLPGEARRLGPATVSGEARFADGVLDVARAEVRWASAQLEVRGPMTVQGPRGVQATARGDLSALSRLFRWDPSVSGRATVVGEARGRWQAPELMGQVRAPALVVSDVRLDRVAVAFSLQDGGVRIERGEAALGESEIQVGGRLSWPEPRAGAATFAERLELDLEIRAPAARIEDVNRWLPEAWRGSGRFALAGRLDGLAARWRGSGQIEAAALSLGYPLERLNVRFVIDSRGLEVPALSVRALGIPVTGKGEWQWDGRGRLAADLGPATLATLPGVDGRLALAGMVSGRASLERDGGRLSGMLNLTAADVSVVGLPLGTGTAHLALRADALEADAAFPAARLTLTATGRLAEGAAADVRMRVDDFDVAPIIRQVAPAATVEGRASARADLTVPLGDPARAQGTIVLDPLRLVIAGESWQNRGPLRLRRSPGVVHLESVEVASTIGTLSAAGAVHDGGRLDVQARGRIPLKVLATLRPEIREAAGVLAATVRIAGTTEAPEASGEGTISDGLILLRDYPEALRGLRAELRASPSAVRIVKATATMGGGSLEGAGEVRIEEGRVGDFRVAVTARRVAFTTLEGFETAWDADLELVGFGPRALLRGEARLVRGLYARDISLLRLLFERRPPASGPSGPGVHLDLGASLNDNLVVRTTLARLRAGGTLRIQGTTGAPIVFGTLTVRDGEVVFRRQIFTLTSASVRFTDPRRIDPELDVRGIARIRDYDVTMQVTGPSNDLKITFTSSPQLPEEDVLSLVAFGATRAQMGGAGAGAFVGEAAAFLVQDLFGVQASATGVNVYMDYAQGPQTTDERRLRIEYQVIGPLRVAGEQDFRGGFGGDVLIRFRFR